MISPIGKSDLRAVAWVLGFQCLLVLPFLGQAFHMDDGIYLDIAQNVLRKPLAPLDFPYCFEGYCAPDMASHSHPPFVGYWTGLLLWLTASQQPAEHLLHLGFLIFPLLFALSIFVLARRFSASPVRISLLAIASPVAVVMSHNLMSDYPNLAFWTAAIALYVFGVDHRRAGWVWLSSLLLTLAAFTTYPALLAAAICWFYALLKRSRMACAYWAPVLPFAWMAFWLTQSSLHFGRFVLSGTTSYFMQTKASWSAVAIVDKVLAFPILLAGTVSLPIILVWRAVGWMRGRVALFWVMAVMVIGQMWVSDYRFYERVLFVVLMSLGGLILFVLLHRCWVILVRFEPSQGEWQDTLFLMGWVGVVVALALFVYSAASARYLLPMLPPFVLLAYRRDPWPGLEQTTTAVNLSLSISVLLALALSFADFEMARVHRQIADQAGTWLAGWESQVRFGGEWGFRHYMRQKGFHQFLSTSDNMAGGQFVLLPQEAIPYRLPQDVESMIVPVARKSWTSDFPVRTMNRSTHAGFYSSGWGLLPFSISRSPVETLTVLQVSQLVEGLPEITVESPAGRPAVPSPAPGGGVDLQVPTPGRLSIPYNGPFPAQVLFEWFIPADASGLHDDNQGRLQALGEIDASYVSNRAATPLTATASSGWKKYPGGISRKYQFAVPDLGPGQIVVQLGDLKKAGYSGKLAIRNWTLLPAGWTP